MLYRAPRLSVARLLRTTLARIGAAVAGGCCGASDIAHFDTLPERHLRDLGLRRYDDRHFHQQFYR
jgi:hypothetical protein